MQKVKVHELRKLSDSDLVDRLTKERVSATQAHSPQKELAQLRVQKVSSQAQVNLQKIRVLRKGVAKILTILSEKRRDAAKASLKGKHTPRDLR